MGLLATRYWWIAIFLLALLLRMPGLGSFMTADEERWMVRASVFWHELLQGNPAGTLLTTHPGTSLLWLSGAGQAAMSWFSDRPVLFEESDVEYYRLPAKLSVALAISLMIGVITWLLSRLWRQAAAGVAGILLACDPFLIGMSQIVHLDALLALSMLMGLVALLCFIFLDGRHYILIAGMALGVALTTKFLPALWLLAYGSILLLTSFLYTERLSKTVSFKAWGMWLATIAVSVFVLMPNFWVMSGFQNDNYPRNGVVAPFATDVQRIVNDAHIENLEENGDSLRFFYLSTILARVQPFVLILVLGVVVLFGRVGFVWWRRDVDASAARRFVVPFFMLAYSVGFILVISWIAKKSDRYALPALVVLLPLSAWVATLAWRFFEERFLLVFDRRTRRFGLAAVCMAVIVQPLLWSPYAIAYDNGLFVERALHQQGWGEGLDAAAAFLNTHPLADSMYIASWYPSVMAHYFKGNVLSLSARDDNRVGFVVLYRNMGDRGGVAADIVAEYEGQTPVHTVHIQGVPYVWVYDTGTLYYFDRHVGEVVSGVEVGQIIPVTANDWEHIDIGISTFSSRVNTGDVTLHIREGINATNDIRTITVNARQFADRDWHRFRFAPIPNSAGVTYYVAITSDDSSVGDAVTVHFSDKDIRPGEMVHRRGALKAGEVNDQFIRASQDMAYRL